LVYGPQRDGGVSCFFSGDFAASKSARISGERKKREGKIHAGKEFLQARDRADQGGGAPSPTKKKRKKKSVAPLVERSMLFSAKKSEEKAFHQEWKEKKRGESDKAICKRSVLPLTEGRRCLPLAKKKGKDHRSLEGEEEGNCKGPLLVVNKTHR